MPFAPSAGDVFNIVAGVLLVALGVFVATIRPRVRGNLALAAFSAAFGAMWGSNYLANSFSEDVGWRYAVFGAASVVATVALVELARTFPRRLERGEWGLVAVAGAVGVGRLAVALLADPVDNQGLGSAAGLFRQLPQAAFAFALVLMALRMGSGSSTAAERHAIALMALAVALYPAYLTTSTAVLEALPYQFAACAVVALLSAAWLHAAGRVPAESARVARRIGVLVPAIALAGAAAGAFAPGDLPGQWIPGGIRVLTVVVLAYAILERQLLGIDVRARWTVSKTTVAAVFIAVFFVASEGSQVLFGRDDPWIGVLASGALVFALAPLQRAADRIAARAVPAAEAAALTVGSAARGDAEADYATALRAAMRDGRITKEEELALARLADRAGLDAETVVRIRHEVEEGRTVG